MRISNKSIPPRLHFNQSETVNSILTNKKNALEYVIKENVKIFLNKNLISASC